MHATKANLKDDPFAGFAEVMWKLISNALTETRRALSVPNRVSEVALPTTNQGRKNYRTDGWPKRATIFRSVLKKFRCCWVFGPPFRA